MALSRTSFTWSGTTLNLVFPHLTTQEESLEICQTIFAILVIKNFVTLQIALHYMCTNENTAVACTAAAWASSRVSTFPEIAELEGASTQMPRSLSYSRGKWKANDTIQAATHPFPLHRPRRPSNQRHDIIPVASRVLFPPAARLVSWVNVCI